MTGVVALRLRSEWRRRGLSLCVLTLLVGLVGAVVLGTVAGARRTRSAVDRFVAETRTMDAFLMFEESLAPAERIAALPETAATARFQGLIGFTDRQPVFLIASVDGNLGVDVVRDLVVAGRRPRPGAAGEIAVPERLARDEALELGDRLRFRTVNPDAAECFTAEVDAALARDCELLGTLFRGAEATGRFATLAGPDLDLEVVGITRGPFDVAQTRAALTAVLLGRALYEDVGDDVLTFPGALVRYAEGVSDEQFEEALSAVVDRGQLTDFQHSTSVTSGLQTTADVVANGLLVFAAVVAVFGAAAIGQAIARQALSGSGEREALRALGLDTRGRAWDVVAPLVPAAAGGAVLAVVGAVAVSPLMPIRAARRFEPDQGVDVDAAVLLVGAGALALAVLALGVVAALLTRRHRRVRTRWPRPRLWSVEASLGARFALDPGRAREAVPVRTALSGAAIGVAGVLAAAAFGAALSRLIDEPARYGYGWDMTLSGCDDVACTGESLREREARVAAHPDVAAVARIWQGFAVAVEGRSEQGYAQRAVVGEAGVPILDGRAPVAADEVALGAKTLRGHGVGIGDRIDIEGTDMEVVGRAVFPSGEDSFPLAEGVLLSDAGLRRVGGVTASEDFETDLAVRLAPGVDAVEARQRLALLNGGDTPSVPAPPLEIDDLAQLELLPIVLAGVLILVAFVAVGHAVTVTVRRRLRDLAVVRALGLAPRRASAVVRWQASTMALTGFVIGAPIGLVLGRVIWGIVADAYGVANDPAWPWAAVVLVGPVTVLVVQALAWRPGRHAARVRPADALRSE